MVVVNFVFFTNTAIKMAMATKLSTVINISAFFYQLLFIHNYPRMSITFYGLHAVGMNSVMGLEQGVNIRLLLYNNRVVLSSWLSLEH